MSEADFVMQTLGAIVQTYASILAICGAFYAFIIEREKTEMRQIEEAYEKNLKNLHPYYQNHLPDYYENTMKLGFNWLVDRTKELTDVKTVNFTSVSNLPDFIELKYNHPKYERLKKQMGTFAWKSFQPVGVVSMLILMASITVMYFISQDGATAQLNFVFLIIVIISLVAFIPLIRFIVYISRMMEPVRNKSKKNDDLQENEDP